MIISKVIIEKSIRIFRRSSVRRGDRIRSKCNLTVMRSPISQHDLLRIFDFAQKLNCNFLIQ